VKRARFKQGYSVLKLTKFWLKRKEATNNKYLRMNTNPSKILIKRRLK